MYTRPKPEPKPKPKPNKYLDFICFEKHTSTPEKFEKSFGDQDHYKIKDLWRQ